MTSHNTPVRQITRQIWVAGQIRPEAMRELAAAGFSHLVNHRPDAEEPGQPSAEQIAAAAVLAGLKVVTAPVRGLPDVDAVTATREAIDSLGPNDKALLFCRSGMRSAAAWAMAERLRGADPDVLRTAAAEAGYDLSRLAL